MHRVFVSPPEEFSLLKDVTLVYPRGLILDSSGHVVLDQMDEVLSWLPDWYGKNNRSGNEKERILLDRTRILNEIAIVAHAGRRAMTRLDESVDYLYVCHPFGFFAFGHLFDSLQRLRYWDQIPGDRKKVIHSSASRIVDFQRHMKRFGVEEEDLVLFDRSFLVPRLWVTPWQSPPAQINKDMFPWIYESYTKGLTSENRVRLYLARNHVRPGERGVVNEPEVVSFLREHKFTIVMGTEGFEEIVRLFHNSEAIVGAHGSLFANTIFCREDCRIVEYCANNRVDYSFKSKMKKAQDYRHRVIEGDAKFNVEIPISELEGLVSELGS